MDRRIVASIDLQFANSLSDAVLPDLSERISADKISRPENTLEATPTQITTRDLLRWSELCRVPVDSLHAVIPENTPLLDRAFGPMLAIELVLSRLRQLPSPAEMILELSTNGLHVRLPNRATILPLLDLFQRAVGRSYELGSLPKLPLRDLLIDPDRYTSALREEGRSLSEKRDLEARRTLSSEVLPGILGALTGYDLGIPVTRSSGSADIAVRYRGEHACLESASVQVKQMLPSSPLLRALEKDATDKEVRGALRTFASLVTHLRSTSENPHIQLSCSPDVDLRSVDIVRAALASVVPGHYRTHVLHSARLANFGISTSTDASSLQPGSSNEIRIALEDFVLGHVALNLSRSNHVWLESVARASQLHRFTSVNSHVELAPPIPQYGLVSSNKLGALALKLFDDDHPVRAATIATAYSYLRRLSFPIVAGSLEEIAADCAPGRMLLECIDQGTLPPAGLDRMTLYERSPGRRAFS